MDRVAADGCPTRSRRGPLLHFPPLPELPERLRGQSFAVVEAAFLGSEADGRELLRPLRDLGPAMDTFAMQPPVGLAELHMDPRDPSVPRTHALSATARGAIDDLAPIAGPGSPLASSSCATSAARSPATRPAPAPRDAARPLYVFSLGVVPRRDAEVAMRRSSPASPARSRPTAPATTRTSSRSRPTPRLLRRRDLGPPAAGQGLYDPRNCSARTTQSRREEARSPARPGLHRSRLADDRARRAPSCTTRTATSSSTPPPARPTPSSCSPAPAARWSSTTPPRRCRPGTTAARRSCDSMVECAAGNYVAAVARRPQRPRGRRPVLHGRRLRLRRGRRRPAHRRARGQRARRRARATTSSPEARAMTRCTAATATTSCQRPRRAPTSSTARRATTSLSGDSHKAPAADVIDGGPGRRPHRAGLERPRPTALVNLTLGGGADDGRPGEGDDVRNVEKLISFHAGPLRRHRRRRPHRGRPGRPARARSTRRRRRRLPEGLRRRRPPRRRPRRGHRRRRLQRRHDRRRPGPGHASTGDHPTGECGIYWCKLPARQRHHRRARRRGRQRHLRLRDRHRAGRPDRRRRRATART